MKTVEPCRHLIAELKGEPAGTKILCTPCSLVGQVHPHHLTVHRPGLNAHQVLGRIPWKPARKPASD
jgi:hypothetical protein